MSGGRGQLVAMVGAAACIVVASPGLVGCVPGDVSLDGKSCPCAQGWQCDESRDVCVRDDAIDEGGIDARADGGDPDAGMRDAGMRDAGMRDSDVLDSGPSDGGGGDLDAGPDDAGGGSDGGTDAAMMDAGMDAGTDAGVDAGPDETACDDALSDALLCEDFELASFGGWHVREIDGTVEHVTSMSWRGDGAMRATTTAGSGRAVIDSTPVPDVTSGDLYLRAYYYVPSDVTLDQLNMLYAGTDESPYVGISLGLRGATAEPAVWVGPDSSEYRATGFEAPLGEWFCAQMHIVVADTGGSVDISIDGTAVASWNDIDTLGPAGFGGFSVGLEWTSSAQASATLYVDEAAISRSPLPCD